MCKGKMCIDCVYFHRISDSPKFGICLRKRRGTPASVRMAFDEPCKKFAGSAVPAAPLNTAPSK